MRNDEKKQNNQPISYEIKDHIGSLSVHGNGWTKEINIVAWNDAKPRLDIREWSPKHDKMSRGIGLNAEEVLNLMALMKDRDIESLGI